MKKDHICPRLKPFWADNVVHKNSRHISIDGVDSNQGWLQEFGQECFLKNS